ncbi:MAG TPA: hypothetical protein VII12_09570 [Thermoanaerobaculia bacterium]|jgi:hypothetical protein
MLAAIVAAALLTAFRELDSMCAGDHGRMWGVSLCGPTLFVDRQTREVIANGPVPSSTLPASIGIANTSLEWNGQRWTMVVLPLPADDYQRRVLLIHESFHRVQPKLGFVSPEMSNAHLDRVEGRYLLQLEWRALAEALRGNRAAIGDALAFRARRRQMFPNAAADEHALEMNEGLAEYTGTAFAEPSLRKRIPRLLAMLREAEKTKSFVRSFAYASGPAWGAILEMRDRHWTRRLRPSDDFGDLAGPTHSRPKPDERYGGPALLAAERVREEKRQATMLNFRARFVEGPHLVLPLRKFSFEMNPDEAIPFEPFGTVYPTLMLRDEWGTIVVKRGGALMGSDWMHLTVPRPTDDYTLTLNEGWRIEGDTIVKKDR